MKAGSPDIQAYVQLFQRYGEDLGSIYGEPDDDRYAFLFEQVVRLLIQPSPFNLSLPEPFRHTACRHREGDPAMRDHLEYGANRRFMLCYLHDLVMLRGGLALKRGTAAR